MSEDQQESQFGSAMMRENGQSIVGEELAVQLRDETRDRICNAGANAVVFVFGENIVTGVASCKSHEMRSVIHHLLVEHPKLFASALADTSSSDEDTEPTSDEDADQ